MVEGTAFLISQSACRMAAEKFDCIFKIICQTVQQINTDSVADQYSLDHSAFTVLGNE